MTLAASSCIRCQSAVEAGDLRCPVCYRAVPQKPSPSTRTLEAKILRCRGCGASMEYRAELQALACAFCGGTVDMEREIDPLEQTEQFLLFTVDREEAVEAYRRWLHDLGFFRPFDLASASRLESLRALWWVGWVFDADALVTWTADSDAGRREAPWAPHAGEFPIRFDDVVVPATTGLSLPECARLIPTYALGSGVSEPVDSPAGTLRERFGVTRSTARTRIVETIRHLAEARVKAVAVPGSKTRHVRAAIRLRGLVTRRFAFPAYVIAYRYRGRLYRTVISGQEPGCVLGEAPRSVAKVAFVVVLALAAAATLVSALLLRGLG